MAEDKKDEPKIIVDDDWKAQAEAEKEQLAHEVEAGAGAESAPEGASEEGTGAQQGPRELPPASFATLVSSLAMQALYALGGFEDPNTKKRYVDLSVAKHHIDMLNILEEKTAGNLTDEEKRLLDQAIYEVRMQYVQMAQQAM